MSALASATSCHGVHPREIVKEMAFGDLAGLRVLFVNMPLRESAKPNTPPQGPGLLAARLRQYGSEVGIVDLNAYRLKDDLAAGKPNGRHLSHDEAKRLLADHLHKHGEPDIIALSGMITTLRWQEWTVATCRELVPEAFIITGGGLATEIKDGLFQWMPELDAVVHSEGDDILLVLARDILESRRNGRSLEQLPTHIGRIAGKDRFLYGGDRPIDLDELPFSAWDLLEQDVYGNPVLQWYIETPVWGLAANNSSATPFEMQRSLTTVSSRGCPYACKFCFRGAQGERNYGMRSAGNLVAEAQWLQATYGIDFLGFPDDNFGVDKKRMQTLPEAFAPLGGLRWGTHTRLDEIDDRAYAMAKSGCIYIGVGAESASPRTLKAMGKDGFILRPRGSKENVLTRVNGYDVPVTMIKGIETARDAGIHVNCTWIMAFPEETLYDLKTSVAFILWQEELMTQGLLPGTPEYFRARSAVNRRMFVATAYPGTAMCKHPKVKGLLHEHFGMTFDDQGNPIVNSALRDYVIELDDATKVMHGTDGQPLNCGEMPEEQFLEARHYVDSGHIEKILDMVED